MGEANVDCMMPCAGGVRVGGGSGDKGVSCKGGINVSRLSYDNGGQGKGEGGGGRGICMSGSNGDLK